MEHNVAHQVINLLSPTLQTSREVLPASLALPTLETAELMQENRAVSRHIWELLETTQKKNAPPRVQTPKHILASDHCAALPPFSFPSPKSNHNLSAHLHSAATHTFI